MINNKIIKKVISILFIILMSNNSFSVAVSDNDGAAFITKAEFDSLKNDFQAELDKYNSSIDNKIDNAIASYLAGVNIEKTSTLENYIESMYTQNEWATAFTDKSGTISGSNNEKFTRGGWWLWLVYGWNLVDSTYNGQLNFVNNNRGGHWLELKPDNVYSYKWLVKSYEDTDSGNTYYGPYDDILYSMEQRVYLQQIISEFRCWTQHNINNRNTTNKTFDITSLTVPGTVYAGTYAPGTNWTSFNNIQGTNIILYKNYQADNRIWGIMNSSSSCENSTNNYCVDYEKQTDFTEVQSESNRFKGGNPGSQWQEFDPHTGTTVFGTDYDAPIFTIRFNSPKVLSLKISDLCNHIASEYIGQVVPMYAGLPMTKVSKKGKIKFKYYVEVYKIDDGTDVTTGNVRVAIKSEQFGNNDISSESSTSLLYDKTDCEPQTEYTAEFDVDVNKESILYVKVDPGTSDNFARIFINGNPTYTMQ